MELAPQILTGAIERLLNATNAFAIDQALALFASDAKIDDPSVGQVFEGHAGIRDYLGKFFVGYNTYSRLLSSDVKGDGQISIRLDFTGDFGHEIGVLDISFDENQQICHIRADLE